MNINVENKEKNMYLSKVHTSFSLVDSEGKIKTWFGQEGDKDEEEKSASESNKTLEPFQANEPNSTSKLLEKNGKKQNKEFERLKLINEKFYNKILVLEAEVARLTSKKENSVSEASASKDNSQDGILQELTNLKAAHEEITRKYKKSIENNKELYTKKTTLIEECKEINKVNKNLKKELSDLNSILAKEQANNEEHIKENTNLRKEIEFLKKRIGELSEDTPNKKLSRLNEAYKEKIAVLKSEKRDYKALVDYTNKVVKLMTDASTMNTDILKMAGEGSLSALQEMRKYMNNYSLQIRQQATNPPSISLADSSEIFPLTNDKSNNNDKLPELISLIEDTDNNRDEPPLG
jgi:chromosome segregation ATPase